METQKCCLVKCTQAQPRIMASCPQAERSEHKASRDEENRAVHVGGGVRESCGRDALRNKNCKWRLIMVKKKKSL